MEISFVCPFAARGQGRPRFARGRAYKDREDEEYEKKIAAQYRLAAVGVRPYPGPVAVRVEAFYRKPASWSKTKAAATVYMLSRPDTDNILKAVKDALNAIAYLDDAQVVHDECWKGYGERDEIRITIERIGEDHAGQSILRHRAARVAEGNGVAAADAKQLSTGKAGGTQSGR